MAAYAVISDFPAFGRSLLPQQEAVAEQLIDTASAKLRITAAKYGKDLDAMMQDDKTGADFTIAVRATVLQAVFRAMDAAENSMPAITQGSQSALGYQVSMTYLNAGQSLYFLRNELKDLGILRQSYGALEVYDHDPTA